ncbi:MAG: uracil-DNA glycosylase [Bacteriovoracaceae bacterium]|jgi:uracil-DNA glycosylase|nr:uracil-DNA glycosylase [Bacteriovoracaceae bacterium]
MYKLKEHLSCSWNKILKDEFDHEYFQGLQHFLNKENNAGKVIYPSQKNIFQCFNKTPFSKVKVIILGQDPYHGENQAHGLSFSVDKNVKVPPSLRNIFKELHTDLGISTPRNGNLENWAKQGVLLLNTVLTVEKSKANSHRNKGWEQFTDRVIQLLNDDKSNIVFVLWGGPAQKKGKCIDKQRHYVIEAPHPSPLSCYRGFFGSRPFSKINNYLKRHDIEHISWDL